LCQFQIGHGREGGVGGFSAYPGEGATNKIRTTKMGAVAWAIFDNIILLDH